MDRRIEGLVREAVTILEPAGLVTCTTAHTARDHGWMVVRDAVTNREHGRIAIPHGGSRANVDEQKKIIRSEARRIVRSLQHDPAPRVELVSGLLGDAPGRSRVAENALISTHQEAIRRRWISEGRPEQIVMVVGPEGQVDVHPREMPPIGWAALVVQRISRQECLAVRLSNLELCILDQTTDEGARVWVDELSEEGASLSPDPEASSSADPPAVEETRMNAMSPIEPERRKPQPSGYRKLTRMENVLIYNRLREVLHPHPDQPSTFYYAEGHSDATVAQEVIPDFPGDRSTAVGEVRRECFGVFPRQERAARPPTDTARVEHLEKWCTTLERAVVRLCERLGEDPAQILVPGDLT